MNNSNRYNSSSRRSSGRRQQSSLDSDPHRCANPAATPDPSILDIKIPYRDDDGHKDPFRMDMPPYLLAELKGFVQNNDHDFNDMGTTARTAVLFFINYCNALDPPRYPTLGQMIKARALECARSEARRQFLQHIETEANEITSYIGLGLPKMASKHLRELLEAIREMDPTDEWRDVCEEVVQRRFGHLLRKGKVADLSIFEGSESGSD